MLINCLKTISIQLCLELLYLKQILSNCFITGAYSFPYGKKDFGNLRVNMVNGTISRQNYNYINYLIQYNQHITTWL